MKNIKQNIFISLIKRRISIIHSLTVIFTFIACGISFITYFKGTHDANTDANKRRCELMDSIKRNALTINMTFEPSDYSFGGIHNTDSAAFLKSLYEESVIKLVQKWEDTSLAYEMIDLKSDVLNQQSRELMNYYILSTMDLNQLFIDTFSKMAHLEEQCKQKEYSELYSMNNWIIEFSDDVKAMYMLLYNYDKLSDLNEKDKERKKEMADEFMTWLSNEKSEYKLEHINEAFKMFIDFRQDYNSTVNQ